ncbi:MAG TPA: SPOR domain-containing protein [Acidobacteriaceae bacterium]|nr:SPOR domain-containing protein [Acidobacteriaceae bacterium]
MRYAVDREEELAEAARRGRGLGRGVREQNPDTEITLGTRSLLGIFFGLALVCGIFFGLGYSVGRGSASRAALQSPTDAVDNAADSHLPKPSAQQALTPTPDTTATTDAGAAGTSSAAAPGTVVVPSGGAAATTAQAGAAPVTQASAQPAVQTVTKPAPTPVAQPANREISPSGFEQAAAVQPAAGMFMVQVAAVSVEQDAEILVAALQKHGYTAVVRHAPTDALLHVQIGPFPSRIAANDMRSRLLADGYNAVIK